MLINFLCAEAARAGGLVPLVSCSLYFVPAAPAP